MASYVDWSLDETSYIQLLRYCEFVYHRSLSSLKCNLPAKPVMLVTLASEDSYNRLCGAVLTGELWRDRWGAKSQQSNRITTSASELLNGSDEGTSSTQKFFRCFFFCGGLFSLFLSLSFSLFLSLSLSLLTQDITNYLPRPLLLLFHLLQAIVAKS